MSSVEKRFYGVASGTLGTMRLTGQMLSMGMAMLIFAVHIGHAQITPEYFPLLLKSTRSAFILFGILCSGGSLHRLLEQSPFGTLDSFQSNRPMNGLHCWGMHFSLLCPSFCPGKFFEIGSGGYSRMLFALRSLFHRLADGLFETWCKFTKIPQSTPPLPEETVPVVSARPLTSNCPS